VPKIQVNGAQLHYEEWGTGPETILFAHGYLWSGWMFHPQIQMLREHFRCVTFDFRGQGQSELTDTGYDVETLTDDVAALIAALHLQPCHFMGLSMGGFVGMRLAARRPELIRSLMLLATSADAEPRLVVPSYWAMAQVARWLGVRPLLPQIMEAMFARRFLSDPGQAALRRQCRNQLLANRNVGVLRALHGIISRQPIIDEIDRIRVPTLVLTGTQDVPTPPPVARRIHERIRGAQLVLLPEAGHTTTLETPAEVNEILAKFLRQQ
jgi:3-oxoadipate enol-lactonase